MIMMTFSLSIVSYTVENMKGVSLSLSLALILSVNITLVKYMYSHEKIVIYYIHTVDRLFFVASLFCKEIKYMWNISRPKSKNCLSNVQ